MVERRRPTVAFPVWPGRLALGFVLLALAALVAVPSIIQRQLVPSREEAIAADEARTLVTRVQFALARQMSSLQAALLTPDSAFSENYAEALALERSAYPQLDSLVGSLSAPATAALGRLEGLSAEWHGRLDEAAVFREGNRGTGDVLQRDLDLYEAALAAARDLDAELAAAALQRRERVARLNSRETLLSGGMILIAFLSAAAVGWFAHRVRTLAAVASAQRAEAEAALAEMRRLSESRARLMRGITHDLKNPLGAADGYGELLELGLEGELKPGQAKMVGGMRRSIAAALAMIADLLDFSRAESGELEIDRESIDCVDIVREAVEQYSGSARAAGHEVEVRLLECPAVATTDRARANEVVGNLLSNAIKYTPSPGRIIVTTGKAAGDGIPDAGPWVCITVSDSGPGIPDAERERIFDDFHRLHTNEASGHGLGLATSRRIAEALGGRLTLGEADEGGAAFTLWLPAAD